MDPITLRIQTDLLSEIESEAEDLGYSSRAEYIRQLLQHRRPTRELLATDDSVQLADPKRIATNEEDIRELQQQLDAAIARIESLEERVEPNSGELDTATKSETTTTSTDESSSISELETWITEQSPQSEQIGSVILFAAELLQEDGPLRTGELKTRLYDEFPDAYKPEHTLWGSTIGRAYQEAPGFSKPQYGMYDFE